MNGASYARLFKQLLPPGKLWLLEAGSWIRQTLLALGDEHARVDVRGDDLIEETDPRAATETLDEWEEMLGLPDEDITAIPATDADRQVAVTQKLVQLPNCTPAGFETLALACGYEVTVTDDYGSLILRSGRARSGDRLYSSVWAHVFSLEVSPPAGAALTHAELEAVITRQAPYHTFCFFTYL